MIVGPKRLEPTGFMESTRVGGNTTGGCESADQNLPARLRMFVAFRYLFGSGFAGFWWG
jgi:hypothetical protein